MTKLALISAAAGIPAGRAKTDHVQAAAIFVFQISRVSAAKFALAAWVSFKLKSAGIQGSVIKRTTVN